MVRFLIESLGSAMEEENAEKLRWEILRVNPSLDLYLELYRNQLAQ